MHPYWAVWEEECPIILDRKPCTCLSGLTDGRHNYSPGTRLYPPRQRDCLTILPVLLFICFSGNIVASGLVVQAAGLVAQAAGLVAQAAGLVAQSVMSATT